MMDVTGPSGREPPSRRVSTLSNGAVHPALQDIDPATRIFYTPHTITGLILGRVLRFTLSIYNFTVAIEQMHYSGIHENRSTKRA